MKKVGLWDRAVFVVTADHGVSFLAGKQRRDPSTETIGGIAHVPLLVRAPGQRTGAVDDTHRCTTDTLGMVATLLKVKVPWPGYDCTDQVHVAKFDASQLTIPLADLLRTRQTVLSQMLKLFGSGDWPRAYRFGPHPELIGKAAASLPQAASQADRVALENDFTSVDPTLPSIPVLVQGPVTAVPAGTPVAIAVNGTIAATAETFDYQNAIRVAAAIPPTALRPGRNAIEVFRIVGPKLQSLGGVNL
jgi:hypothetical protein